MQRNALNNKLMRLLASIADYTKTGEIGNVSSPSSVLCALVDDGIFTHAFISDPPDGECLSAFWNVLATFPCDGGSNGLGGMFELLMTASCLVKIPAILFNKFDQIAIFQ